MDSGGWGRVGVGVGVRARVRARVWFRLRVNARVRVRAGSHRRALLAGLTRGVGLLVGLHNPVGLACVVNGLLAPQVHLRVDVARCAHRQHAVVD